MSAKHKAPIAGINHTANVRACNKALLDQLARTAEIPVAYVAMTALEVGEQMLDSSSLSELVKRGNHAPFWAILNRDSGIERTSVPLIYTDYLAETISLRAKMFKKSIEDTAGAIIDEGLFVLKSEEACAWLMRGDMAKKFIQAFTLSELPADTLTGGDKP